MTYMSNIKAQNIYLTEAIQDAFYEMGRDHFNQDFPAKGQVSKLGRASIMMMLSLPKDAQSAAITASDSLERVPIEEAKAELRAAIDRIVSGGGGADDVHPGKAAEAVSKSVLAVQETQEKKHKG